jgi:hypothetical protein
MIVHATQPDKSTVETLFFAKEKAQQLNSSL